MLGEKASREKGSAKKPALFNKESTKIYLTDLAFLFFVVIFILASWFLWRYSNIMAMRFIGSAVASFGYVLCLFFFLDATFLFLFKRNR